MSNEERPSDVLARAHRAWSPSHADAERVRGAITRAVAAGATVPDSAPIQPAAVAASWARRALMAFAIAGASGGAGYWVGQRAGYRAGLGEAQATTSALPAAASARPASASPSREPPPPPVSPDPRPASPSLVPSRHGSHAARSESPALAPEETDSLAVELRALRNIERALRDGNPGLALAFLDELDRQVPHGQLSEERDAAATLARCARGDHPFGVDLAQEFTEHHPSSVYRARIEQACAATDSRAAGDSPSRRSRP